VSLPRQLHEDGLELAEDAPEALASALVRGGVGLRSMTHAGGELESIFVQLAGEGHR
jgi:hypothetical protein